MGSEVFGAMLLSLIVVLALPATSRRPAWQRHLFVAVAVVFTVLAVTLLLHVVAEDDYRQAGVSRWSTYNAKPATVLGISSAALTAGLAVMALRRRSIAAVLPLPGLLAVGSTYAALAQMTN